MKGDVQDPEVMSDHMTSEDLHWDDQRVLEQVTGEKEQGEVSLCVCVCMIMCINVCALLVNGSVTDDH